jgi:hypothetical protein
MLVAVQVCSIFWLGKLLLSLSLGYHGILVISKHAFLVTPQAPRRLCYRNMLWYLENKAGIVFYGKLDQQGLYLSQFLIILPIVCPKSRSSVIVLIPYDALPPLQFRRLSMKIRS